MRYVYTRIGDEEVSKNDVEHVYLELCLPHIKPKRIAALVPVGVQDVVSS